MSYKDKYINRGQAYQSIPLRNTYIENTQNRIKSSFVDNPSYEEVFINDLASLAGVWIVEDTKNPYVKKIIMQPQDPIKSGWTILWDEDTWLVISVDNTKSMNSSGFIVKCNVILKWRDHEGEIHSYHGLFEHGARTFIGVYTDKVMTTPDGRRWITIQKSEHTSKIKLDDRFLLDGLAYKVVDFDSISREGLIELSLIADQINTATDNLELGIADYYKKEPKEENDPSDVGYSIIVKSNSTSLNEIKYNREKDYYVEVYQDSVLVENQDVVWTLFADDQVSSTDLAMIVDQTNSHCIVKNNGVTSGSVQLKAELVSDPNVFTWVQIKMKSLF